MWNSVVNLFKSSSKNGLYLPSAYDNRTNKGSVSLLFAHIANAVAIVAIGMALYEDLKFGVICSISYAALMLAFYLIRSLSKFKVDVDDGQIELDGGNGKTDEKDNE